MTGDTKKGKHMSTDLTFITNEGDKSLLERFKVLLGNNTRFNEGDRDVGRIKNNPGSWTNIFSAFNTLCANKEEE